MKLAILLCCVALLSSRVTAQKKCSELIQHTSPWVDAIGELQDAKGLLLHQVTGGTLQWIGMHCEWKY